MNGFIKRKIYKSASDSLEEREDLIAIEKRLKVSVNAVKRIKAPFAGSI